MGYLAMSTKGTKIEIKTHQNFLSRLLVLFMVYVLSISGLFSAILASFSSTRVPFLKTLILLRNTRELGEPVLKVAKSVHSVTNLVPRALFPGFEVGESALGMIEVAL